MKNEIEKMSIRETNNWAKVLIMDVIQSLIDDEEEIDRSRPFGNAHDGHLNILKKQAERVRLALFYK